MRIPRGDAHGSPAHPDRPSPGPARAGAGHGPTPPAGGQRPASRPGGGTAAALTARRTLAELPPPAVKTPRPKPPGGPSSAGRYGSPPEPPVPVLHPKPPPASAGRGPRPAPPLGGPGPLPDGTGPTDRRGSDGAGRPGAPLRSPTRPAARRPPSPRRRGVAAPLPPQLFTVSSAPSPPPAPCRLCPWLQLGWAAALIRTAESPSRRLHGARFPRRAPAHTQSGAGPARSYHGNRARLRHGRGRGGEGGRRRGEGGGEGSSGTGAGRAQAARNAFARAAAGALGPLPRAAVVAGVPPGRVPGTRTQAGLRPKR